MSVGMLKNKTGLQFVWDGLEIKSPYAGKRLRQTEFFRDRAALERELSRVRSLRENPKRRDLGREADRIFASMKELGSSAEALCRGERLTLEELFDIKCLLLQLQELKNLYESGLQVEGLEFPDAKGALALLDPEGEGRYEFELKDSLSPELGRIRQEKRSLERSLYGKNAPAALRSRFDALCLAEDREEKRLTGELCRALAPWGKTLLKNMESTGHLELLLRKAAMPDTVLPELTDEACLSFTDMWDPALRERLAAGGRAFVPVSLQLTPGTAVLTGANMGGKSVALRTLALNCALALCGFPVYAEKAALPPQLSEICLIAGDREDEAAGLSSFGGEMAALREALAALDGSTLLLLDEPGRGTNPAEGAALVRALAAYLNRRSAYSLLTTHFDGVAGRGNAHYTIREYRPERMPLDAPIPREALRVCRELGLPEELLCLAEQQLEI